MNVGFFILLMSLNACFGCNLRQLQHGVTGRCLLISGFILTSGWPRRHGRHGRHGKDMENKNRHGRHGKLWLDMEKIGQDFIS